MRRVWVIAAAVSASAVLGMAGPASAHVEVQPAEAAAGQPATFSFRVPNEETSAAMTSLMVRFPADHPVPNVIAPPMDGWTITVTNRTLAAPLTVAGTTVTEVVDTVTWSGSLPVAKADYFDITTGPLPTESGELVFSATQTYDNGVVVEWNQPESPGGPEPPHPAPVLRIAGGAVPPSTVAAVGSTAHDHDAGAVPADGSSGGPSGAVVLAAVAVAVVAIGAATTLLYRRVSRR